MDGRNLDHAFLEHCLNHEFTVAQVVCRSGDVNAVEYSVLGRCAPPAGFGSRRQQLGDPRFARFSLLKCDILQDDVLSGQCGDVRNAVTHQAGPQHANCRHLSRRDIDEVGCGHP